MGLISTDLVTTGGGGEMGGQVGESQALVQKKRLVSDRGTSRFFTGWLQQKKKKKHTHTHKPKKKQKHSDKMVWASFVGK